MKYYLRFVSVLAVWLALGDALAQPVLRGFADIPGIQVSRFFVEANYAYVTTTKGRLRILNISDPLAPSLAAEVVVEATDYVYGADLAVFGQYLYVNARNSIVIFDISDKEHPARAGSISYTSTGLDAVGDRLYVSTQSGLLIFGLENPIVPSFLGRYNSPTRIYDATIRDGLAYCAAQGAGFLILDVSTPSNPTRVGGSPIGPDGGDAYDVALEGNYAYVSGWRPAGAILSVFDIRNPVTPPRTFYGVNPGANFADANYADGVAVKNGVVAICGWSDKAHVYDLRNLPAGGSAVTVTLGDRAWNVGGDAHFAGDMLVVANASGGLRFFDVSNPAAPVYAGAYGSGSDMRSVVLYGNFAYALDWMNGIITWDISDPTAPAMLGRTFLTSDRQGTLAVAGGKLMKMTAAGIEVFSLTDPARPTPTGNVPASGYEFTGVGDVVMVRKADRLEARSAQSDSLNLLASIPFAALDQFEYNGTYLAVDVQQGNDFPRVIVANVSDLTRVRQIGSNPYGSSGFALDGNVLYSTEASQGLNVFTLTPDSMTFVKYYHGVYGMLAAANQRLYLVGPSAITVIDGRDPANLAVLGGINVPAGNDAVARGAYLYSVGPEKFAIVEGAFPPPADLPELQIRKEGSNLIIQWPTRYTGFRFGPRARSSINGSSLPATPRRRMDSSPT